jgi:transcription elongation factor B subunit 2
MGNVFLKVRRQKTTLFLDAKEAWSVLELKRVVAGIVKRPPEQLRLFVADDVVSTWVLLLLLLLFGRGTM